MTPLFATLAMLLASPEAHATQAGAQAEAQAVYEKAADESLRASAVRGMQAFTHFGKGSWGNAWKSGVEAFRAYDRAGKLDDARNAAARKAHALGDGKKPAPAPVKTTFSRLDPAFLKQGEAAAAAAELEKVTGIRGGRFLSRLSKASDDPVEWSDPKLGTKLLARIEDAGSDLREGRFKTMFRAALKAFPASWLDRHHGHARAQVELALAGKAGLSDFLALTSSKAPAATMVAEKREEAAAPAPVEIPVKEAGPEPEPVAEAPALPLPERLPASPGMVAKAQPAGAALVKDLFRAQADAEASLFRRVHRRYQSIAFGLSF